jgi:hypothetical protein
MSDKKDTKAKDTPEKPEADQNKRLPIDRKHKLAIMPAKVPSPVKVYTNNVGRLRAPSAQWELPTWDLAETGRILDTESYVRRAFRNKRNLFLKEGHEFVGANPDRIKYIEKRVAQIEMATEIPFPILLSRTIASLTQCSNAFWVKARNIKASGGRVREIKTISGNTKRLKPVAGYFPMAAETVRFKRDEYGKILKYQQFILGKETKEFAPEDVVHFYFDKREGFSVGTPILASVKDDIRALRRIEENVELLVYQHLFPLFHYKVGTEKEPAEVYSDGTTEIDDVRLKIANMPSDGCWVTPERHSIEVLGAEGEALAVDKVIAHFKQRIFTGLGNSSVDMGEGDTASRSTAQTMSRNLIDDTKADQKEFGAMFYSFIIQELLLESTFDPKTLFDDENRVYLKFNEIDIETRQAKENHLADLFLKNAITHIELRQGMGRKPFEGEGWPTGTTKGQVFRKGDGDWAHTSYGIIERDKIILQSLDEPGTDAAKSETKSRTTANKSKSAGGNSVSNKNKPANQHGTRSSTKLNKDILDAEHPQSLNIIYSQKLPIQNMYKDLGKEISDWVREEGLHINRLSVRVGFAFERAKDKLTSLCIRAHRIGTEDVKVNPFLPSSRLPLSEVDFRIKRHVHKYSDKLRDELIDQIDRNTIKRSETKREDAVFISMIFNALEHRTAMIDNSEIMRAYNYGRAGGLRVRGVDNIVSKRSGKESCEICDSRILRYTKANAIIYEELPPLHPNCTCIIDGGE